MAGQPPGAQAGHDAGPALVGKHNGNDWRSRRSRAAGPTRRRRLHPDAALVYVCARAATVDHRIFLLPSDATPQAMFRLQTEGTVLRALMNTFTGNNAMLVGDLGMSANVADLSAAARDRPDVLHVALRAGLGDQLGKSGQHLATIPLRVRSSLDCSAALWNNVAKSSQPAGDPGPGIAFAVAPSPAASTVALSPTPPPVVPPAATSSTNTAQLAVTAAVSPAPAPTPPALAKAEPLPVPTPPAQPEVATSEWPEPQEDLASEAPAPAHPTVQPNASNSSNQAFGDGRTSRIQECASTPWLLPWTDRWHFEFAYHERDPCLSDSAG